MMPEAAAASSFIPSYAGRSFSAKSYRSSTSSTFQDDTSLLPHLDGDNAQRVLHYRQQLDAITTTFISNIPLPPSPLEGPLEPPSKFSNKVNTNYIPNVVEREEIKEYVFIVNQELSELNAKITEMKLALMEATKTRDRLQTVANQHQALISPIRRLPPELLQIIFVCCLPSHHNAVMHSSEAPVLLGRICSEWRRISLSTPELWSSLHIVPPNVNFSNLTFSTAHFKRKRELIEMWLGRSGTCPLNISFVWLDSDSEDEIKLCANLLEALVPMCGRWQMLDFQVPLKMFKPFVGLTVKDVPRLEGLSLMDNRTPLSPDVVEWPESLVFAESAMKLRNFTLTFFSGGLRLPSIPWHQLTTLYLESNISFFFPDSRQMLSTFSQCAHLQNCTLKFPLSHTASIPPFEKLDMPITLPQLQVLYLDGDQHLQNTFHMSNTLTNLCAPNLRKLEIVGRSGRPERNNIAPEPLVAMRTLLEQSKCPLEKLTVESMTLPPEEFIACLKLAPTLVELVVQNWAVPVCFGPQNGDADYKYSHLAENRILRALTIAASCPGGASRSVSPAVQAKQRRKLERLEEGAKGLLKASENKFGLKASEDLPDGLWEVTTPSQPIPEIPIEETPSKSSEDPILSLCPNLQRFNFTLCDASQAVLCDFVESRWVSPPPGVSQIKSIKCSFTAFEDEVVKMRFAGFKSQGLDVIVSYQIPVSNDDLIPSPWTGLEAPGIVLDQTS